MKAIAILGSPKKKGNTAKMLEIVKSELEGRGHELEILNLSDHRVEGCRGCYACQKSPDRPGCVQKDDAMDVFDRMIAADAVVYATPLYCWGFSSQIKALVDRHMCIVRGYMTDDHTSFLEGKTTALLVTCGGPVEGNTGPIQRMFDNIQTFIKARQLGKYIVPLCSPGELGEGAQDLAEKLASDLADV